MNGRMQHLLRALALGGLTLASASVARAEEAPKEQPQPFRLDRLLGLEDTVLHLGGSYRGRYSGLHNQYRPGLDQDDQAFSFRGLFEAGLGTEDFGMFFELQDSRAYLTDEYSGVSTIVVNAMEILQAKMDLHLSDAFGAGTRLDLAFGRQTMDLGSSRFVARHRHRDTIQSYTGLTADLALGERDRVFAFAVLPVTVLPTNNDREALLDNEIQFDQESFGHRFFGLYYETARLPLDVHIETYAYYLSEDDSARQTRNRNLLTPGVRIFREPSEGQWDTDVEGLIQFGSQRLTNERTDTQDLETFAYFTHAEFGYTLPHAAALRLDVEGDVGSGDRDPTDDTDQRFDSLFGPRRAEFGPTGIYGPLGRENIVSGGVRAGVEPHPRFDAYVSWRANALMSATDLLGRTQVSDPTGSSGTFAGHTVEVRARYWALPESVLLEVGGAYFKNGEFFERAPTATGYGDPMFVYTDASVLF